MVRTKLTRVEKNELNRRRLWRAAAEIIAEHGFKDASIARITSRAGVAMGTFYNYFDTRESLFAELMDWYGKILRSTVKADVKPGGQYFEREEITFRAYFLFLKENPFFVKVLNEAEIFVPKAYVAYFESILRGYKKVLKDAIRQGHIRRLSGIEIDSVALILMATRQYYGQQFWNKIDAKGRLPKRIVTAYMTFVRGALAPTAPLS